MDRANLYLVLHVRVVSPRNLTGTLVARLEANPGVIGLVLLEGVSRNPAGDSIEFDVITAEANEVLGELRALEVDRDGFVAIDTVDSYLSERATQARRSEPAAANVAPIWEEAEARIRSLGIYPPSWFALLTIAGLIAAVGIFTNSQILIVAAMVVGPEYGAIINVSLGRNEHDRARVRKGMRALIAGFAIAIAVSLLFSLAIRLFDLQSAEFQDGVRPVSDLINTPNVFSVIVAVLAGIVGVVSLTEARANALIGVFVSVTTIPAAADVGVSTAFASWHEAWGSLVQLLLNVTILVVVGAVGLNMQRRFWTRWARGHRAGTA